MLDLGAGFDRDLTLLILIVLGLVWLSESRLSLLTSYHFANLRKCDGESGRFSVATD